MNLAEKTMKQTRSRSDQFRYLEFFCGGGMVRAGLSENWSCVFANDFDPKKSRSYRENWGGDCLVTGDIAQVTVEQLPLKTADLAWASFPCQDLSLAGNGAGLNGDRSGTFWDFWRVLQRLDADGRAPTVVALENVCGALTSHDGRDFEDIVAAFVGAGYMVGALVIDAAMFVPQSRPRLFFVGMKSPTLDVRRDRPAATEFGASTALLRAHDDLPVRLRENWVWWKLPEPCLAIPRLSDIYETAPTDVKWHSVEQTDRLLKLMSEVHLEKLRDAKKSKKLVVGTVYRRMRRDDGGVARQRAEVRFDGVAGCLRTPSGGSSRQVLLVVDGNRVRSRLMSARETARLMGLPDTYKLPKSYNEAYHLTGDGVAVPVVSHLAAHLFEPLITEARRRRSR